MSLFNKGNFKPIDNQFLSEGMDALLPLKEFKDANGSSCEVSLVQRS